MRLRISAIWGQYIQWVFAWATRDGYFSPLRGKGLAWTYQPYIAATLLGCFRRERYCRAHSLRGGGHWLCDQFDPKWA